MIKGIDHYQYYQTLSHSEKELFLLNNFPQWYKFVYETRELCFNAVAFNQWYKNTNLIEADLWFKVIPLENQKAVLKLWANEISAKPIIFTRHKKDPDPDELKQGAISSSEIETKHLKIIHN